MTLDPKTLKPRRDLILGRRYELPETLAEGEREDGEAYQIVTPEAWRTDRSTQVFEVVRVGDAVPAILGMELTPDDIVVMERSWQVTHAVGVGTDPHFFLQARKVTQVHPWNPWEGPEDDESG